LVLERPVVSSVHLALTTPTLAVQVLLPVSIVRQVRRIQIREQLPAPHANQALIQLVLGQRIVSSVPLAPTILTMEVQVLRHVPNVRQVLLAPLQELPMQPLARHVRQVRIQEPVQPIASSVRSALTTPTLAVPAVLRVLLENQLLVPVQPMHRHVRPVFQVPTVEAGRHA